MGETQKYSDDLPEADSYSIARFSLELRAMEQGFSPEQQFRSEMAAAGNNVVSYHAENGRQPRRFLARLAAAVISLS